jgi:hypothetical protein
MARNCDLFFEGKLYGSKVARDDGGAFSIDAGRITAIASKLAPTGISVPKAIGHAAFATTFVRGDNTLTSTKLTNATLRL